MSFLSNNMYFSTGERVSNLNELTQCGSGCVKTDKGTELEADIIFKVVGDRINPSAYQKGLGKNNFDLKQILKVCMKILEIKKVMTSS